MLSWQAFELHNHTFHSDGRFTVDELCRAAERLKFQGVALTDHNTDSGCPELADAGRRYNIKTIAGMEWTLFYGHMLVLGAQRFIDFRHIPRDGMDAVLPLVKEAGGVTVIAHPWRIGNPLSTGFHWEYEVGRWDCIDAMEVWHSRSPHREPLGKLGFDFWERQLSAGRRITATYGRDWHFDDDGEEPRACTYLGLDQDGDPLEALRRGRSMVTLGPILTLSAEKSKQRFEIGDTIKAGLMQLEIGVVKDERADIWEAYGLEWSHILMVTGKGVSRPIPFSGEGTMGCITAHLPGWVRAELHGRDRTGDCLLAFTSAIYVE